MSARSSAPPASSGTKRPWGAILVWVAVLGLLAVLGIGLVRAQQGPVGVGSKPQPFTLRTFDGAEYDTGEMVGQVVVINFWASWCTPCEQEAAELEQAHQRFKDQGVVFLGVNYVDTETEAKAYLAEFGITYPNGPDLGTRISQAFRIRGVPETYILGRDGRLAHVMIGPYASLDDIVQAIEAVQAQ
ncbi:MAG: TlpA disulfide reductase family protein [Chloroflexi bacterium]|nr:TlpA disulfide reductase family protein [Chloroflexota bacterium]